MKKDNLDNLVKVTVICVAIVFIMNKLTSTLNTSNDVYAIETNNKYINVEQTSIVDDENIKVSMKNGVQVIEFDLQTYAYPTINIQNNMPVELIINVDKENLNTCNYKIISPYLGIEHQLEIGKNVIEFIPTERGEYIYSCWMGMIGAKINIREDNASPSAYYEENISIGGCCTIR